MIDRLALVESQLVGCSSATGRLRSEVLETARKRRLFVVISGEPGTGKFHISALLHQLWGGDRQDLKFFSIGDSTEADRAIEVLRRVLAGEGRHLSKFERPAKNGCVTLLLHGLDRLEEPELGHRRSELLNILQRTVSFLDSEVGMISTRVLVTARTDRVAELLPGISYSHIEIPPLRERREDITPLARHFLLRTNTERGTELFFEEGAINLLEPGQFPGNIKELQNTVLSAAFRAEDGMITKAALDPRRKDRFPEVDELELAKRRIAALERDNSLLRETSISAQPIWPGPQPDVEEDYCFILMPFDKVADVQEVYVNYIKPTVEDLGLRCERADDIYGDGRKGIMQEIWDGLNRARIVLADVTGRNSNVFYELGIAHTLGRPVLMITQSIDDVPFDLRHLKFLLYEYKPRKIEDFEHRLKQSLKGVLSKE